MSTNISNYLNWTHDKYFGNKGNLLQAKSEPFQQRGLGTDMTAESSIGDFAYNMILAGPEQSQRCKVDEAFSDLLHKIKSMPPKIILFSSRRNPLNLRDKYNGWIKLLNMPIQQSLCENDELENLPKVLIRDLTAVQARNDFEVDKMILAGQQQSQRCNCDEKFSDEKLFDLLHKLKSKHQLEKMSVQEPSLPDKEPAVNTSDWRTQQPPDSRQKNVNALLETLKKHVPHSGQEGTDELMRIAVSFEELIFNTAIDQEDYLGKLLLKMQTVEKGD